MTSRPPATTAFSGLSAMLRRLRAGCLAGLVLVLFPAVPGPCQPGTDGDVGYSTGTDTPAPPQALEAGKDKAAARADAPALSITLEGYGKKEEPAPGRAAPEKAAPETSSPAVPPPPAPPSRDSGPLERGASAAPARPSPVTVMLESTLRGDYATTRSLARRMPQKRFDQAMDKSRAKTLSKQGNDLLNKKDDPPAALEAYRAAYANDPSSSEITGSYGYALFRNGRFAEARDMETQCLELAPEYAAAWFVLGQIYGYLKQEDMAYASFVNTCLFTKNISTSLGFLEREIVKYGEVTVQQAAARALTACRSLSSEGPAARPAPAEPAPMRQGAGQAAPPAAPAGAGVQWKNARIGKVDIRTALMDSRLFQSMIAKMAKMPKSQIDSWLDAQLGPVIVELQGILRGYATANNFLLVIKSEDERKVRGDGSLRTSLGGLVEDDGFVAYLDTPEGRAYRRTAPIQDLTPVVAAKLSPR